MNTLLFIVMLVGMAAHFWLLYRFVRLLRDANALVPPRVREGLEQMLLSGGGGIRVQLEAMAYLLSRGYKEVQDAKVTAAGDLALASFWLCGLLLLVCATALF